MNELNMVILLAIVLSGVLLWLLIPRHKKSRADIASFHSNLNDALPSARHYAYFRQIRQALSAADAKYIVENAPPQVAKQALRDRRAVARRFLKGLHEDFSNLARLGRIIAALSPVCLGSAMREGMWCVRPNKEKRSRKRWLFETPPERPRLA